MYRIILFFSFILCTALSAQSQLEELGRFGETGAAPGQFKDPVAIDLTANGQLYICDLGNQRIQVFDLNGNFLMNFGGFGWQNETFDNPVDIWARSTINIYVADYNNQRVQRFDKDFHYLSSKYSNPGAQEKFQFMEVLSVAYSPQGDLFILEAGANKIIKFNGQDQGDVAFGYYESGRGELTFPVQLELSNDHRVIVSDAESEAVFVYDYFGNFLYKIQHPLMKRPGGLAIGRDNRIYTADAVSQSIFEFTPAGKLVSQFKQVSGIPLKSPADLCLFQDMKETRFYIIDGDEVIIAKKVTVSAGE